MSTIPSTWMTDQTNRLSPRRLRDIRLPGARGAGMHDLTHSTLFSNHGNTRTQYDGIAAQLRSGARYFDIRPAIWTDGAFHCGQFSENPALGWQGSTGEILRDAFIAIRTFAKANPRELIILGFSGYRNCLWWRGFDSVEKAQLAALTRNELGGRMITHGDAGVDLAELTLDDLLRGDRNVLCLFDDFDGFVNPADGLFGMVNGRRVHPVSTLSAPAIACGGNGRLHAVRAAGPSWILSISDDGGGTWGVNRAIMPHRFGTPPAVAVDGAGTLHLAWSEDPCHPRLMLSSSPDQGRSWSPAATIAQLPDLTAAAMAHDPDGDVLHVAWRGGGIVVLASRKHGEAGWTRIPVAGLPAAAAVALAARRGRLCLAVLAENTLFVTTSGDGGSSWTPPRPVDGLVTMTPPALAMDDDGGAILLGKPVFDNPEDRLSILRSADFGATWTAPAPIPITAATGRSAAAVATGGQGYAIVFPASPDGNADAPAVLNLCGSSDGGRSWDSRHVGMVAGNLGVSDRPGGGGVVLLSGAEQGDGTDAPSLYDRAGAANPGLVAALGRHPAVALMHYLRPAAAGAVAKLNIGE